MKNLKVSSAPTTEQYSPGLGLVPVALPMPRKYPHDLRRKVHEDLSA